MGLSNLPPGCRDSDIPGNRPEDMANEQIYDNIHAALSPLKLDERMTTHEDATELEQAVENLFKLINNAHESGYAQCQSDADEARYYASLEQVDNARLDDITRQEENERRIQSENTRGEEFAP